MSSPGRGRPPKITSPTSDTTPKKRGRPPKYINVESSKKNGFKNMPPYLFT